MSYLRNEWYVVALAGELIDRPVARRILGEPLVLFRTASGKAVVLEDRCPHRGAALSLGAVEGDTIACGYHGFTFDAGGRCVHIPGMATIPPQARVKPYPVIERWGWVFAWMGDATPDESKLPDFRWTTEPGYAGGMDYLHVGAAYTLVRDNLLDLTHARYVHKNTLATDAVTDYPVTTEAGERYVRVRRAMPAIEPSPFFRRVPGFRERVDHSQRIDFIAPCYVLINVHIASAAASNEKLACTMYVLNALTPEDEHATHYFWGLMRDSAIDDAALTEVQQSMNRMTFAEDAPVLEAQQQRINAARPGWRPIATPHDAGLVQAERLMQRLIAAERATAA